MQIGLAEARQERVTALAERTANRAARLYRRQMNADFDVSWRQLAPLLLTFTQAAQVTAAAGASPFMAAYARADDQDDPSGGNVQAGALSGVDASGRELEGLLFGAVTTAKTVIGKGGGLQSAFAQSATYLAVMVKTAIHDTARTADLTAMTSRGYTEYVRVINAGACSRCAILAGKVVAQKPFKRHPGCKCGSAPRKVDDDYEGRYANPTDYFNSLNTVEQDRVFTKAGAEAIRAGADPVKIVAARRNALGIDYSNRTLPGGLSGRRMQRTRIGTAKDGTPILGYTTTEGVMRRGAYGQQNRLVTGTNRKRIRVMPETLIGLTDDVELRKVLLRDAGYLDVPVNASERGSALGGGYSARRALVLGEDRRIADAFYRAHGISLG